MYHGARAASFKACVAVKIKQVEKVMQFAIAEAVQQAKEDFESTCPSWAHDDRCLRFLFRS